jgi:hypothetical protein
MRRMTCQVTFASPCLPNVSANCSSNPPKVNGKPWAVQSMEGEASRRSGGGVSDTGDPDNPSDPDVGPGRCCWPPHRGRQPIR